MTVFLFTSAAFASSSDIKLIEEYMNGLTTLQARFIQMSSSGEVVEGDFYLSRPGKLRLAYDPHLGHLVVADGKWLYHYDPELKQASYLGLDSTPAGLLVQAKHDLSSGKEVVITATKREKGLLSVTLHKAGEKTAGQITMVFNEGPLALKQWKITDAQGNNTWVSLNNLRSGVKLDKGLFEFVDPRPLQGANPQ